MARTSRWSLKSVQDGVATIEITSWKYFHDYIRQEMLNYSHYVWRGQRDASWNLRTSLDRAFRFKPKASYPALAEEHLYRFKLAARGRRGGNPPALDNENEWWALAQHFGMATPLLDWTESAFVALYFAFEKEQVPPSGRRAVWALGGFQGKINELVQNGGAANDIIELVRPMQDENARLVSQSGLFSRAPYGQTVDSWIKKVYQGVSNIFPLIKITFPNEGRPDCLRTLNKMNINHLSLFPDLYGASQHCNKSLSLEGY